MSRDSSMEFEGTAKRVRSGSAACNHSDSSSTFALDVTELTDLGTRKQRRFTADVGESVRLNNQADRVAMRTEGRRPDRQTGNYIPNREVAATKPSRSEGAARTGNLSTLSSNLPITVKEAARFLGVSPQTALSSLP